MYLHVFKDSEASKKAWLSRARAIVRDHSAKRWVNPDGTPLPKSLENFIKKHIGAIPPAWAGGALVSTDLSDPQGLLAMAAEKDDKGRQPRIYSSDKTSRQSQIKFARVERLNPKIPQLLNKSKKDMLNPKLSDRERDNAATVYLCTKTGFRPGSNKDTKAEEQAYGASTLERRHIHVKGEVTTFDFVGKKGVRISKSLRDKAMAEYLTTKLQQVAPHEPVFKSSGASAMRYLRGVVGEEFLIKDLRTWNGTAVARALIGRESVPDSEKALKDQQKRISTLVASHLGNTPKVALDSYINPMVWVHTGGLTPVKESKK